MINNLPIIFLMKIIFKMTMHFKIIQKFKWNILMIILLDFKIEKVRKKILEEIH